jgi:murein L,D-transpeptidase YcbB/YkuD
MSLLLMLVLHQLPLRIAYAEGSEHAMPNNAISQLIAGKQHPYLILANFQNRAEDVENLYKDSDYKPLWVGHKLSEKPLKDVVNLLTEASNYGLNPVNYDIDVLQQKISELSKSDAPTANDLALLDTAISIALLRFSHDLHYGRINPQGINFNLKLREKKLLDLPSLIKQSLQHNAIALLPTLVEPTLKPYQQLKLALAAYRHLSKTVKPVNLTVEKALHPGEKLANVAALRDFLVAIGDMAEEKKSVDKTGIYSGKVVDGVKQFQHRHGLVADGVIGKETALSLNTPLSQRISQIELAMERLRWLPRFGDKESIIVNIPAFKLWAFNDFNQISPDIVSMNVVVGKALENQTPVLMAEMRYLDFMPYWNVPYSIIKNEILPKLLVNNAYLDKENMELVPSFGNEVKAVAFNATSLEQLKQGRLKVRQRPGGKNALGKIKFIFPNHNNVYLHDTPSINLFVKSRRDFSHGCVRVEKPDLLAEFVLKDQDGWNKDSIKQALDGGKTQRVLLKKPIGVLFFYTTAFFDQENHLTFYQDIYGHDPILQTALSKPQDLADDAIFVTSIQPAEATGTGLDIPTVSP